MKKYKIISFTHSTYDTGEQRTLYACCVRMFKYKIFPYWVPLEHEYEGELTKMERSFSLDSALYIFGNSLGFSSFEKAERQLKEYILAMNSLPPRPKIKTLKYYKG